MPVVVAVPKSVAGHPDARQRGFVCSWTDGGWDAAWVHVDGELDVATAGQLKRTLDQPELQARLVVLDLRELEFIDRAGVHAIVTANNRARQAARQPMLLRGPPCVDRMFMLTGCLDALEIGDLDPQGPPVQVLLQFAEHDLGQ